MHKAINGIKNIEKKCVGISPRVIVKIKQRPDKLKSIIKLFLDKLERDKQIKLAKTGMNPKNGINGINDMLVFGCFIFSVIPPRL